ncbi:MAG TPA: class I SAM-dependent methyltransferase, partial [Anaerolineae bacterium]
LPVWRALYRFYFYRLVPLLGGLISGQLDAYRYLPQSLSDFVAADELARIMMSAGVREVKFRLLMLGTVAIHWGLK